MRQLAYFRYKMYHKSITLFHYWDVMHWNVCHPSFADKRAAVMAAFFQSDRCGIYRYRNKTEAYNRAESVCILAV